MRSVKTKWSRTVFALDWKQAVRHHDSEHNFEVDVTLKNSTCLVSTTSQLLLLIYRLINVLSYLSYFENEIFTFLITSVFLFDGLFLIPVLSVVIVTSEENSK